MAGETKWTPGPWDGSDRGRKDSNFGGFSCRVRADAGTVAKVYELGRWDECQDTARANARLIAAAPDLYAALEELVARRDKESAAYGGLSPDGSDGRYARARAALRRARGEE